MTPATTTKLVTFDLDGTLYELPKTKLRMVFACFPLGRVLRVGRAAREELSGRRFDSGAALIDEEARIAAERLGRTRAETKTLLHELFNLRLARVLRRVGPRPGVRALLDDLVARGVKIAVISDRGAVVEKLTALGLADLPWSALVSADDVGILKPDGALFAACADRCGVSLDAVVHVGDRDDKDGAGARAAGCSFVFAGVRGPLPSVL